jgi:hypothetical protein
VDDVNYFGRDSTSSFYEPLVVAKPLRSTDTTLVAASALDIGPRLRLQRVLPLLLATIACLSLDLPRSLPPPVYRTHGALRCGIAVLRHTSHLENSLRHTHLWMSQVEFSMVRSRRHGPDTMAY